VTGCPTGAMNTTPSKLVTITQHLGRTALASAVADLWLAKTGEMIVPDRKYARFNRFAERVISRFAEVTSVEVNIGSNSISLGFKSDDYAVLFLLKWL